MALIYIPSPEFEPVAYKPIAPDYWPTKGLLSSSPKKVIPCHYNASFFWIRNAAPADDRLFKAEVEKMGIECVIMKYGYEFHV